MFAPRQRRLDAIDRPAARYGMPLYNLLFVSLHHVLRYFYTAIIFNPDDVSENMRKYGGFIPGIRPGKRTAEYIDTILTSHHLRPAPPTSPSSRCCPSS
jgi:preprotein translocase subunit SecY